MCSQNLVEKGFCFTMSESCVKIFDDSCQIEVKIDGTIS